jgi:hypothetical protein
VLPGMPRKIILKQKYKSRFLNFKVLVEKTLMSAQQGSNGPQIPIVLLKEGLVKQKAKTQKTTL